MKILFVSSELPPEAGFGGIGTYVAHLAPALAARGHTVSVLSRTLGATDSDVRIDGVRVVRVADREAPADVWQKPFDPRAAKHAKAYYDRAFTVALALQEDPALADVDVIEAADWGGEAALVRAMLPDVPYVVKFHTPAKLVFAWNASSSAGADARTDPAAAKRALEATAASPFVESLHALESIAVQNAAGFTCPSRWMVGACEKLFDIPPGHVAPIANPFAAGPAVARRRADVRRVLYVGRLEARKGVVEAVAPMCRVLRALPDVEWRLAGADTGSAPGGGSMREALTQRIPADLRARVKFLGALDRAALGDELASADAVLLPSRHENFPYACLEAMAAGAAVVASRHGGMAEMIESERTGLLVDPRDPGSVVEALLRALEQPFFAEELGRAAAESVRERYRPDVVAPQVEEHYARVLAAAVAS